MNLSHSEKARCKRVSWKTLVCVIQLVTSIKIKCSKKGATEKTIQVCKTPNIKKEENERRKKN